MFSFLVHTLPPLLLWFRSGKEGQMIYIYTLARLRVSAPLLCIFSFFSSSGYFISNHKSSTLQDESMMGSGCPHMFSTLIFVLRLAQTWFLYLLWSPILPPHRTTVTKYDARSLVMTLDSSPKLSEGEDAFVRNHNFSASRFCLRSTPPPTFRPPHLLH